MLALPASVFPLPPVHLCTCSTGSGPGDTSPPLRPPPSPYPCPAPAGAQAGAGHGGRERHLHPGGRGLRPGWWVPAVPLVNAACHGCLLASRRVALVAALGTPARSLHCSLRPQSYRSGNPGELPWLRGHVPWSCLTHACDLLCLLRCSRLRRHPCGREHREAGRPGSGGEDAAGAPLKLLKQSTPGPAPLSLPLTSKRLICACGRRWSRSPRPSCATPPSCSYFLAVNPDSFLSLLDLLASIVSTHRLREKMWPCWDCSQGVDQGTQAARGRESSYRHSAHDGANFCTHSGPV